MEQWKIIQKEPNYEVSSLGRVRNISTQHVKSNRFDKDGYPRVTLYPSGKTYSIHRLIMENFYDKSEWKAHVNHIDSNRANSTLSNLEWVTAQGNTIHMHKAGRAHDIKGVNNPMSTLTEEQIVTIRMLPSLMKDPEVAKMYGVSRATIQRIRSGSAYTLIDGPTTVGRSKGSRGATNNRAKLTELQAIDIKYNLPEFKNSELAAKYSLSIDAIRRIRTGKSWTHL